MWVVRGQYRERQRASHGCTSRILQQELPQLRKQYWGRHFWAIGFGAWSTGNVTEEDVKKYLGHRRHPSNREVGDFILE